MISEIGACPSRKSSIFFGRVEDHHDQDNQRDGEQVCAQEPAHDIPVDDLEPEAFEESNHGMYPVLLWEK